MRRLRRRGNCAGEDGDGLGAALVEDGEVFFGEPGGGLAFFIPGDDADLHQTAGGMDRGGLLAWDGCCGWGLRRGARNARSDQESCAAEREKARGSLEARE